MNQASDRNQKTLISFIYNAIDYALYKKRKSLDHQ